MKYLKLILLISLLVGIFLRDCRAEKRDKEGPLILTPYIESGAIQKARRLSRVTYFEKHFESFSGFFTTQKKFQSNIFFWFFPAQMEREKAPVLLWLNGGPGSSSLFGLFVEHGPIIVNETNIVKFRTASWTLTNSVLYVDSPVGTGFSNTKSEFGYAKSMEDVVDGLYSTLHQFFNLFPELRAQDFYLTGESYAGKYIPNLGYRILEENNKLLRFSSLSPLIKLRGISIGNGFIDPYYSLNYPEFLYNLGLIDEHTQLEGDKIIQGIKKLIIQKQWKSAFQEYDKFIGYSGRKDNFISKVTGLDFYYNILVSKRPPDYDYYIKYVEQPEIRKALHVGGVAFDTGHKVMHLLVEDIMTSGKRPLEYLLNNGIRMLIYNGQLDLIVPNRLTEDLIREFEWYGLQEYLKSPRKIWKLPSAEIGGYYKNYLNFTRLTVRNCGHMVPYDNSKSGFYLIQHFTDAFGKLLFPSSGLVWKNFFECKTEN